MFRCAIEIQDPGSYAAGVFDVGCPTYWAIATIIARFRLMPFLAAATSSAAMRLEGMVSPDRVSGSVAFVLPIN